MRSTDPAEELDLLINIAAEREVIGSLIMDPSLMAHATRLRSDDFSEPMHGLVWRAIDYLIDRGEPVKLRSVTGVINGKIGDRERERLEIIVERASGVSDLVEKSVDEVIDASRRREMSKLFRQASRQLQTQPDSVEMAMVRMIGQIDHVMTGHGAKTMAGDAVANELKKKLLNPPKRIATGITKLDHVLGGGFDAGRGYSFIAKYKIGKTTLAATFVDNATRDGTPVTMISLERQDVDIEKLIAARNLGINSRKLETHFSKHEKAFDAYAADPRRKLVNYHHQPGAGLDEICNVIVNGARGHGSKLAIIDYYQIVAKPPKVGLYEHLSNVAQTLANLFDRLGIAGVIMSQADADGLPRDCKNLLHAAAANFTIRRASDQIETFLENLASNYIEQTHAGSPTNPAMMLDKDAGPHFRDVK